MKNILKLFPCIKSFYTRVSRLIGFSHTIARRLSTVRHADEILVLKKGTIAERGTHTELMQKKSGLYHKLFSLQSATGEVKL